MVVSSKTENTFISAVTIM